MTFFYKFFIIWLGNLNNTFNRQRFCKSISHVFEPVKTPDDRQRKNRIRLLKGEHGVVPKVVAWLCSS